jgi:hypothetical protein
MTAFRAIVVTLLFSSFGVLFWLTQNYQKACPTAPDEQAGAVYPLDEHGRIVYLTLAEHQKLVVDERCLFALCLCVGAIEVRDMLRRRARRNSMRIS